VLEGRNDRGRAPLAGAVPAAFWLQAGPGAAESWQSWEGGAAPAVTVEFDADGCRWRLSKRFGGDRRGEAVLEVAKSGHPYRREAAGRSVDGKLRELLGWGLSTPGGKGRGSSKASFLVTALLANQGQVDSILAST